MPSHQGLGRCPLWQSMCAPEVAQLDQQGVVYVIIQVLEKPKHAQISLPIRCLHSPLRSHHRDFGFDFIPLYFVPCFTSLIFFPRGRPLLTPPVRSGSISLSSIPPLQGTRMRGGVGAGGEKPPATRLADHVLRRSISCRISSMTSLLRISFLSPTLDE
ncbi:MAG: hypothetical protein QG552_1419 [Thermodesulfobacteriota bacterium]|nr:hypothetical protein [Thermodesulfobacteriota bacterium]